MQFYILMIDYGKGPRRPMGYGADVRPEQTRREVIDEARSILASANKSIAFVKFVDGNFIDDITSEIIAEAKQDQPGELVTFADLQAAAFDHARDHAKNWVA